MRKKMWVFMLLIVLGCCLGIEGMMMIMQEKADAATPLTTLAPPEGNTTFVDGTTWCIALSGVPQIDLQNALDWACGLGKADCGPIQEGGPCYQPNTLMAHASYAFNTYYQQNGKSDIACNFGGTATLTKNNPSYDKCSYDTSGSIKSSAPQLSNHKPNCFWWKLAIINLLLYFGI